MANKNKVPSFSIIIPTLNEEIALPYLLNDLSKQTFKDFELIIVDAKSGDRTVKKAERFKSWFEGFSVITSEKRNVSYQRNLGAKNAKSQNLIFLDADNRLPSYFLQGIKYHVEMSKPDILSSWINADSKNNKDKAISTFLNIFIDLQKKTKQPFLLESFVYITKRAFFKLKGFDESVPWGEGSALLKQAIARGMKFTYIRNPKYTYSLRRIRKQGTLKTFRNVAQIELSRLTNSQLPIKLAKNLYPMEGGTYFEISDNERNRFEKFFIKLISTTQNTIENGDHSFLKFIFKFLPKPNK